MVGTKEATMDKVLCEHCNKPITSNPLIVHGRRNPTRKSSKVVDDFDQFFHQSAYDCANAEPERVFELHRARAGVKIG